MPGVVTEHPRRRAYAAFSRRSKARWIAGSDNRSTMTLNC
jgi:hypothetical protein